MNIEQKDQIFFQNLPGTGSVRPAPKTEKPKLSMDPFHPFTKMKVRANPLPDDVNMNGHTLSCAWQKVFHPNKTGKAKRWLNQAKA